MKSLLDNKTFCIYQLFVFFWDFSNYACQILK